MRMRVCICGGGSLSHAIAGVLGANKDVEVTLLTRQPNRWREKIRIIYLDIAELIGRIDKISDDPREVVPGADYVIISVPAYARGAILEKIRPHLKESTWVGSFPGFGGFDWQAKHILGQQSRIFGIQRVPYVRRLISYGEAVWISGIRPRLFLATLPSADASQVAGQIEKILNIPVTPVTNYLNVSLSPSNSLFHPPRIYSLFKDWHPGSFYQKEILFYEEWDDRASEIFLECDWELQEICRAVPLNLSYVKPILEHYGASDSKSLTSKIRNIRALRDRYVPMIETKNGLVPDFFCSYVSEDIPYGLVIIKAIAQIASVPTPMIDKIIYWAQGHLKTKYLEDGNLAKVGMAKLPIPQNFNISTLDELVKVASA